jgi:hypothetical protein
MDKSNQAKASREPELALIEGGPGASVMKRLGLIRLDPGIGTLRTAMVLASVAWLPLVILSLIQGRFVSGDLAIPFLSDLAAHTRFLVAIPIFILAEIPIRARLIRVGRQFIDSGTVRADEHERFIQIVEGLRRLRDSRIAELTILGLAYAGTYVALTGGLKHGRTTWYQPGPGTGLSAAGYWYSFVSLPMFQFLMYRWIYRLAIWGVFLRRVAKLNLNIVPTHPDGAGGLDFVGKGSIPFGIIVFALGAVVSSAIATNVLYAGSKLQDYQQIYIAFLLIVLVIFAGPLILFAPKLAQVKRDGLMEYGAFASRYTQLFHDKWVKHYGCQDEPLLGTGDIQSLADLGNSYLIIRKMRVIPIEMRDFVALVLPGVLPAVPLLATVMPVSDILKGLLRLLA